MHFCQDEARALITAIENPHLLVSSALAHVKRFWAKVRGVFSHWNCPDTCQFRDNFHKHVDSRWN